MAYDETRDFYADDLQLVAARAGFQLCPRCQSNDSCHAARWSRSIPISEPTAEAWKHISCPYVSRRINQMPCRTCEVPDFHNHETNSRPFLNVRSTENYVKTRVPCGFHTKAIELAAPFCGMAL